MNLQMLDFDCTEDADGIVCWDALAQPMSHYNQDLLHETELVLTWAYGFDDQGPGPLENGANWDFDLQVKLLDKDLKPQSATPCFVEESGQLTILPRPTQSQTLSLSLALSGTSAFAQAFRSAFDLA